MAAYRRGGGRNCAVLGCSNNQRKLSQWREQVCEAHSPLVHRDCPCLEPFYFHQFPSDKEKCQVWAKVINRKGLIPGKGTVVCSRHFLQGGPTEDHPLPVLHINLEKQHGPIRRRLGKTSSKQLKDGSKSRAKLQLKEVSSAEGEVATLRPALLTEKELRFPPGSWEQATVEAIMKLRNIRCPSSEQIAQTIIACLKDENDYLRKRTEQLVAQLKSVTEEMGKIKQECQCHKHSSSEPPPDPEGVSSRSLHILGSGSAVSLEVMSEGQANPEAATLISPEDTTSVKTAST